jgi:hypothetical protein
MYKLNKSAQPIVALKNQQKEKCVKKLSLHVVLRIGQ